MKIDTKKIKLILTDIDGIFTDNTVTYSLMGKYTKSFHFMDFAAIGDLKKVRPDIDIKAFTSDCGQGCAISRVRFDVIDIDIMELNIQNRLVYVENCIEDFKEDEFIFVADSLADVKIAKSLAIKYFMFPCNSIAAKYYSAYVARHKVPSSGLGYWQSIMMESGKGVFAELIYTLFEEEIYRF